MGMLMSVMSCRIQSGENSVYDNYYSIVILIIFKITTAIMEVFLETNEWCHYRPVLSGCVKGLTGISYAGFVGFQTMLIETVKK